MPELAIFDFDGTLVDSGDIHLEVFYHLSRQHGIDPMGKEELDKLRSLSIRERLRYFQIPIWKVPGLVRKSMDMYGTLQESVVLFPGIREVLEELVRRGIILVILSSNSRTNILRFLEAHHLDCFQQIRGNVSLFGKHRAIKSLVRKARREKTSTVYLGDEIRDIVACKKIGVPVAAVTWGYDNQDLLESGKPDHLVCTPEEILKLFPEKWRGQ